MSNYRYYAYGLRISSELPLPAPAAAEASQDAVDLTIRFGQVHRPPPSVAGSKSLLSATPQEVCCAYRDVGAFLVRAGREIVIDADPAVDQNALVDWLQGPVLSMLLHQRGFFVLHASAVAVGETAVALVGHSGQGKSTTAAALAERGHRLIVDDTVAIQLDRAGRPWVTPGFPHMKLKTESLQFLGEDPAGLAVIYSDEDKRRRFADDFSHAPVRLSAVCLLAEGPECAVERLSGQSALVEMMHHAYVARFTEFLRLTGTTAQHFHLCTGVASGAAICRLRRPKRLSALPTVMELIERQASGAKAEVSHAVAS